MGDMISRPVADRAIAKARAEGRLEGLEEACKLQCEGCDRGWAIDQNLTEVVAHKIPGKRTHQLCGSTAIRALKDKEPGDATN